MSYDDEDDSRAEAQAAQELLAEGWQPIPEGTTGLPVGCLPGGYYLARPADPRGGAVVLQGNDGSWLDVRIRTLLRRRAASPGSGLERPPGSACRCASAFQSALGASVC